MLHFNVFLSSLVPRFHAPLERERERERERDERERERERERFAQRERESRQTATPSLITASCRTMSVSPDTHCQ